MDGGTEGVDDAAAVPCFRRPPAASVVAFWQAPPLRACDALLALCLRSRVRALVSYACVPGVRARACAGAQQAALLRE